MKKFDEVQAANFLVREVFYNFPEAAQTLSKLKLNTFTNYAGTIDEKTSHELKELLDEYNMFPRVPEDEYVRAREVVLTLNDALILLTVWGRFKELALTGEENKELEPYIILISKAVKLLANKIDNHYVSTQAALDRSLKKAISFSYLSSEQFFWDWSGLTESKDLDDAYKFYTNYTIERYLGFHSIFLEHKESSDE